MKWNIIGDTHGDHYNFKPNSIQLGDFDLYGYGFYEFEHPVFFIDGNHDNFRELNPDAPEPHDVATNLFYIPRGYVSGKVLFIGGAESIDKHIREPGISWFHHESLTNEQLNRILSIDKPIEVIVSHECPEFVTGYHKADSTQAKLVRVFDKFRPKLWIFGHHHVTFEKNMHDCRFVCIESKLSIEFDLPMDEIINDNEEE